MKHYYILNAALLQIFFCYEVAFSQKNISQSSDSLDIDSAKILQTIWIGAQFPTSFKSEKEFSSQQLLRQAKVSFVSTLENVPGLSAIQMGVGIAKPVIRGMSFNRLVVSENGIKQQGQQWGSDHGLEIDALGVERVLITKGPMALAYGSDAIAGAIEILPEPIVEQRLQIQTTAAYQSNNRLFVNSLGMQVRKNHFFVKGRVTVQDFGDFRVPATQFIYNGYILPIYDGWLKNTAGSELNHKLSLGRVGKKTHITLMWSGFNQRAGIFGGAMGSPRFYSLRPDGNRNIDLPRQVNSHNKLIFNLVYYADKYTASFDMAWQHNLRREESIPHAHGRQQIDKSQILALQMSLNVLTAKFKIEKELDFMNYTLGTSVEIQNNRSTGFEFLIPHYHCYQVGFYSLINKKINKKVKTTAGIRFDMANFSSPLALDLFYQELTDEPYRAPNLNRYFSSVSASCGLNWAISQRIKSKFAASRVFRFPTVNELVSNGIHHGTYRHERGDPSLSPEVGYSADADLELKINKIKFQFSPYGYYFSNYLYLSPAAMFSPLPEAGQIYLYRQDRAFINGFEAEFEYKIHKSLVFNTHYAIVRAKNINSTFGLPFTPPDKFYVRLDYFLKTKNLEVNIYSDFAHHFSQQRTDRNERETPAYHLWGAGLQLSYKQTLLNISLQNIADTPYLNHLSRYRILSIPEPGRNLRISLKLPLTK